MKHWDRYLGYFKTVGIMVAVTVGAGWSEGLLAQKTPSGDAQLQQELQVMKSILSTTLSFLSQPSTGLIGLPGGHRLGVGRIEGLYLKGQGAVFMIPLETGSDVDPAQFAAVEKRLSDLEASNNPRSAEAELRLLRSLTRHGFPELDELRAIAEEQAMAAVEASGEGSEVRPSSRPAPQSAKKPSPAEIKQEIQKLKQELAESRAKAEENRRRLQDSLVDVLSRYGDSLTQLRPDEYVNFVVSSSSGLGGFVLPDFAWGSTGINTGSRSSDDAFDMIMTVKVSEIRAYRAGSIDLATFKSRIQQY